jgi:serine/threonine protein kinase
VQRAVQHLQGNDLVHGDIKDDQFFLTESGSVVLGDFGTAWKLVDADGVALVLGGRDDLMTRRCEPTMYSHSLCFIIAPRAELRRDESTERRAGVGHYKAPEVRGRARADGHPLLRDVYAKAEGFSIGIVMCDLLGVLADGDVLRHPTQMSCCIV